jgi:hypothetical protein
MSEKLRRNEARQDAKYRAFWVEQMLPPLGTGWGIAKVAQTTMNKMTSMKKWKGQPAGEYSFGVVPTGAKVPQRTTLSSFEGKPLVIHFYSDG